MNESDSKPRVLFALEWMPAYRVQFFTELRPALRERGIALEVAHGDPSAKAATHRDATSIGGALRRPNRYLRLGGREAVWQPWRDRARVADLVVVNEGARLLFNYWLLARQRLGSGAVALWGHGANLDRVKADPRVEWLKRRIYSMPSWWFAYTEGSKQRVCATGFPSARTTVVQNSVGTEVLGQEIASVGREEAEALRAELRIGPGPFGLFLGSLRESRRLPYLFEAADSIAFERPDFSVVVAGDGPQRAAVEEMASSRPHVRFVGRVDGRRKAALLGSADLLLVPGHIGLNVVDGFAASLPTVTTAVPRHAPEFEYLEDGVNGRILPGDAPPSAFAEAVLALLDGPDRLDALQVGARRSAERYSGAAMVSRFADGIRAAIAIR